VVVPPPALPSHVVLMLGQAIARSQPAPALRMFGFVLLIGVLTRQLNQRAAHKLQQKIDRLTAALENKSDSSRYMADGSNAPDELVCLRASLDGAPS
jgi:hypothetical protein